MNEKNTMRIELPFFAGFYESDFAPYYLLSHDLDNGGLEYYQVYFGNGLTGNDLDVDFNAYKNEVGRVFTEVFEWNVRFACKNLLNDVKFVEIVSPQEYNFETDRVFADIVFNEGWKGKIRAFMKQHEQWLGDIIAKEWTSCDGFVSYLPNTFADWYDEFGKDIPDCRMVGTMLGYMLENELVDPMGTFTEAVLERVCISEFVIDTRRSVSVTWDIEDECGESSELPVNVKIPSNLDEEEIDNWLSYTYGFCVLNYTFN